jgi:hypothetical protein
MRVVAQASEMRLLSRQKFLSYLWAYWCLADREATGEHSASSPLMQALCTTVEFPAWEPFASGTSGYCARKAAIWLRPNRLGDIIADAADQTSTAEGRIVDNPRNFLYEGRTVHRKLVGFPGTSTAKAWADGTLKTTKRLSGNDQTILARIGGFGRDLPYLGVVLIGYEEGLSWVGIRRDERLWRLRKADQRAILLSQPEEFVTPFSDPELVDAWVPNTMDFGVHRATFSEEPERFVTVCRAILRDLATRANLQLSPGNQFDTLFSPGSTRASRVAVYLPLTYQTAKAVLAGNMSFNWFNGDGGKRRENQAFVRERLLEALASFRNKTCTVMACINIDGPRCETLVRQALHRVTGLDGWQVQVLGNQELNRTVTRVPWWWLSSVFDDLPAPTREAIRPLCNGETSARPNAELVTAITEGMVAGRGKLTREHLEACLTTIALLRAQGDTLWDLLNDLNTLAPVLQATPHARLAIGRVLDERQKYDEERRDPTWTRYPHAAGVLDGALQTCQRLAKKYQEPLLADQLITELEATLQREGKTTTALADVKERIRK